MGGGSVIDSDNKIKWYEKFGTKSPLAGILTNYRQINYSNMNISADSIQDYGVKKLGETISSLQRNIRNKYLPPLIRDEPTKGVEDKADVQGASKVPQSATFVRKDLKKKIIKKPFSFREILRKELIVTFVKKIMKKKQTKGMITETSCNGKTEYNDCHNTAKDLLDSMISSAAFMLEHSDMMSQAAGKFGQEDKVHILTTSARLVHTTIGDNQETIDYCVVNMTVTESIHEKDKYKKSFIRKQVEKLLNAMLTAAKIVSENEMAIRLVAFNVGKGKTIKPHVNAAKMFRNLVADE